MEGSALNRGWFPVFKNGFLGPWGRVICRLILGGVFVYAGFSKASDSTGFALDLAKYQLLSESVATPLAFYLPYLEILVGAALLTGWLGDGGFFLIVAMLCAFSLGLLSAWWRGLDITCGCFGRGMGNLALPWALARNALLLLMCGLLLMSRRSGSRWAGEDKISKTEPDGIARSSDCV